MFQIPQDVQDVSECQFYHSMEIPGMGTIAGNWNLIGRLDDYIGRVEVKGRRVLDVGSASGFLSFEMEKRGAEVVSFDVGSAKNMCRLPFENSLYSTNRPQWEQETNQNIDKLRRSYWFAHQKLRSRARVFYGDIYDLPDALGSFDVVVVGMILGHLSDPVSALGSVSRRCTDRLVITEGMLEVDQPIMALCANPAKGPDNAWFHLSFGLYRAVLRMVGFKILNITNSIYDSRVLGPTKAHTIVAARNPEVTAGLCLGAWPEYARLAAS
jgi:SAM-dependent methyltransferase